MFALAKNDCNNDDDRTRIRAACGLDRIVCELSRVLNLSPWVIPDSLINSDGWPRKFTVFYSSFNFLLTTQLDGPKII